MKAAEAINKLDQEKWATTSPLERLSILEAIQQNLKTYGDELAAADTNMKNTLMQEEHFTNSMSKVATVVPVANSITASISLYEELVHGEMPKPGKTSKVNENLWDITIRRPSATDRMVYGGNTEILRVKGEPKQINPLDKPAGVIAVLGAGNYSSPLEVITALFLENCAVVHKPHHLNAETDKVWEKIFAPLIEHGALTFTDHDQGRDLTVDPRLSKIYFTGGTTTAQAIMSATQTPLISECGGNNPCIIVPGDRPWTDKEIAHQAQMIATVGKLNGGAVCGRPQTIITSKQWPQREDFLNALRTAVAEDTPATGTYYPGSDKVKQSFVNACSNAEIIKPEAGKYQKSDFVLITNVDHDGFAPKNEAFCQIIDEVALDVPANAEHFLPAAVKFANEKLLGTLGAAILIDEDTKKAHQQSLDQALTDLEYGGIAVNEMPPTIWLSPYLTWGGNEEGKTFVSGIGNFGNGLNYENVEKSILIGSFMSPMHMVVTNKGAFDTLANDMSRYAIEPSWVNLACLMGDAAVSAFRKKDF